MLIFEIDIAGAINKLEIVKGMEWKDPLKQGMEEIKSFTENDVFNSDGSALGSRWSRLKMSTIKDRSRKGFLAGPILQRTGNMKRSFKITEGDNWIELGNTAEYFKYHQSTKPRSKLPRRAMLRGNQKTRNIIVREFLKYSNEFIRRNKLG